MTILACPVASSWSVLAVCMTRRCVGRGPPFVGWHARAPFGHLQHVMRWSLDVSDGPLSFGLPGLEGLDARI